MINLTETKHAIDRLTEMFNSLEREASSGACDLSPRYHSLDQEITNVMAQMMQRGEDQEIANLLELSNKLYNLRQVYSIVDKEIATDPTDSETTEPSSPKTVLTTEEAIETLINLEAELQELENQYQSGVVDPKFADKVSIVVKKIDPIIRQLRAPSSVNRVIIPASQESVTVKSVSSAPPTEEEIQTAVNNLERLEAQFQKLKREFERGERDAQFTLRMNAIKNRVSALLPMMPNNKHELALEILASIETIQQNLALFNLEGMPPEILSQESAPAMLVSAAPPTEEEIQTAVNNLERLEAQFQKLKREFEREERDAHFTLRMNAIRNRVSALLPMMPSNKLELALVILASIETIQQELAIFSLEGIPPEILYQIFDYVVGGAPYLKGSKELTALKLTSKTIFHAAESFHRKYTDEMLLKTTPLESLGLHQGNIISYFAEHRAEYQHANFSRFCFYSDQYNQWKDIVNKCPNLKSLVFPNCHWRCKAKIKDILPLSTKLEKLHIRRDSRLESLDGIEEFTGLQSLYIDDNGHIHSFDGVKGLTDLRNLYIKGLLKVENMNVVGALTNLQILEIKNISNNKVIFNQADVRNLLNLEKLNLGWVSITDEVMEAIGTLTKLQSLSLESCDGASDDTMIQSIAALTALRNLDLFGWKVSNDGLNSLVHLQNLVDLNLKATLVTDVNPNNIWPNVKSLDLSFCKVTDEALENLASSFPNLESLRLFCCSDLTDQGLRHLSRWENLKEVDLKQCSGLTPEGIAALGDVPFKVVI